MKAFLTGAALFAAALDCAAADVVARMLVATGDVKIVRASREMPAPRGTQVELGDTVRTGEQSNAQLMFTDESIVALRRDSTFVVSEYRFDAAKPADGNLVFNLLKGGVRAISGALAKAQPRNFKLTTPTATVGVRGTHLHAAFCANDCGPGVKNGTHLHVADGIGTFETKVGTVEAGKDVNLHAETADQLATKQSGPPSAAVLDRLEGRARGVRAAPPTAGAPAQPGAVTPAAGQETTQALASGVGADGRVGAVTTVATGPTVGQPTVFATSKPVSSASGSLGTSTNSTSNAATTSAPSIPQPSQSSAAVVASSAPVNSVVYFSGTGSGMDNLGNSGAVTARASVSYPYQRVGLSLTAIVGGVEYTMSSPVATIPLVIKSDGSATFTATFNRTDYPSETFAFRYCQGCANRTNLSPTGTVGVLETLTFNGTISSTGDLTLTGSAVGSASLNRTLTFTDAMAPATPTTTKATAVAVPGAFSGVSAWNVGQFGLTVDSSNRLVSFSTLPGPVTGNVGTASNQVRGTVSSVEGNLVFGAWFGAGAAIRDSNYVSYTSSSGFSMPWITGDVTSTISQSLGNAVYTPLAGAGLVNPNSSGISTGTFNGGTVAVNFSNQAVSVQNLSATRSSGETYVGNGSFIFSPASGRWGGNFPTGGVTCSGGSNCTGTMTGGIVGFFAGSSAQSMGMAYSMGNGPVGVYGVQGFRR